MSIFPLIQKNEQKQAEQAMQEKIRAIESHADSVLNSLADKDLDLADTALVLKVAGDKLNKNGSKLKLSLVLAQ